MLEVASLLIPRKPGRWRSLTAGAGVAAAVLAAALVCPTPAQASAAQGVISGTGAVTDDFGDEATLSRYGQYRYSTAVALWQRVLVAEGFLTDSGVDCDFGPATEAATVKFQQRYGLTADGVVGTQTWSKADDFLVNEYQTVGYELIAYKSAKRVEEISFRRASSYYHTFLPGGRVWAMAYNTSASPYC
ncbi:peptidoglycan-binding domain-containing protein [Micromonospora sp. NPDC007271]|uniref:peptidoglycan-binding domain-containing protein n=1 Tax=Micromonospora sp. NPDC007271 TaxID=3154587 RepID=UPI0033E07525